MTPFDMGKGWPQRKPLRRVSKKRARTNVIRTANARAVYGQRPACHACLPFQMVGIERTQTGCDGWATDLHELVPRGRGGSITDMDNCRPVSRQCHDFAHQNPDLAAAAGLLLSRNDTGELDHRRDGHDGASRSEVGPP